VKRDLDRKKKHHAIVLSKETKGDMIAAIKRYCSEERGEEIGDLQANLILDFILEHLAPELYNQGVRDSCHSMAEMIDDVLSLQN